MNKTKAFKFAKEAWSGHPTVPVRLSSSVAMTVDGEEAVFLRAHENDTVIVLYGKDIDTVAMSCKIAQARR